MKLTNGTVREDSATRATTKGISISVIPSQRTSEMMDILWRDGILGAKSKREFAREAVEEAIRKRYEWAKEKGLI